MFISRPWYSSIWPWYCNSNVLQGDCGLQQDAIDLKNFRFNISRKLTKESVKKCNPIFCFAITQFLQCYWITPPPLFSKQTPDDLMLDLMWRPQYTIGYYVLLFNIPLVICVSGLLFLRLCHISHCIHTFKKHHIILREFSEKIFIL